MQIEQQMTETVNWRSLLAKAKAVQARYEGGLSMSAAMMALQRGDIVGHALNLHASLLHYQAAAKFEECAAVPSARSRPAETAS